ncbi:hypothetical protein BGW36DRAFT_421385 [Talaromyces proteolyticus]|uniref:ABM domain-containing protein n=1 Tax=Talaromyces proteolyticus TaxID=1131652 RepID=A0AAD4L1C2_9EURO|nr:uncharacterized protein BGW36DRAFT_421385 [Talaromyces proteolyticus]KAH8704790.1 hypothetical protein BGW36DRAFT_421385 [Talaromyces proteolyticus]
MRSFYTLTALTWVGSAIAQLPQPGWKSSDPVTAVLTLTPQTGKDDALAAYIQHGKNVTTTECPANIAFISFKVTGKDQYVVIERYTNQTAMFQWVAGPQHTELVKEFLPLANILGSGVESDMNLF